MAVSGRKNNEISKFWQEDQSAMGLPQRVVIISAWQGKTERTLKLVLHEELFCKIKNKENI